ncbi:hypothetical protein CBL_12156 [Carabus blaptoides fortunei]
MLVALVAGRQRPSQHIVSLLFRRQKQNITLVIVYSVPARLLVAVDKHVLHLFCVLFLHWINYGVTLSEQVLS